MNSFFRTLILHIFATSRHLSCDVDQYFELFAELFICYQKVLAHVHEHFGVVFWSLITKEAAKYKILLVIVYLFLK